MWRCNSCGSTNSDNANYCGNCGNAKVVGISFERRHKRTRSIVVLLSILLIVSLLSIWFLNNRKANTQDKDTPLPAATETSEQAAISPSPSPIAKTGINSWENVVAVETGRDFIAALKTDGTVCVEFADSPNSNPNLDVSSWHNIKKISAGGSMLVGLREDGTVIVTGDSENQSSVSTWENIVDISTSGVHTVGVTDDGRVVYAGLYNYEGEPEYYAGWEDVKSVNAVVCSACTITLGFSSDGTLLNDGRRYIDAASSGWLSVGIRNDGSVYFWGTDAEVLQPEMVLWKDIKQVCPGDTGAVGLQSNGQLVFAGCGRRFLEAASWTDIDQIYLFDNLFFEGDFCSFLVGITKNRSVIALGSYLVDTGSWTDIIDVAAFGNTLVGLKANGTIVTAAWSSPKNEAFPDGVAIDFDEIQSSLPLFDNGWLTFADGGEMYVPENFVGIPNPNAETASGRVYTFFDKINNMVMQVSESYIGEFPDVEYDYTGNGLEYYVSRNGQRIDFISALYSDLSDTYADATYTAKGDTFCVFSGYTGSKTYYIKYHVRDDTVYILSYLYPSSLAATCDFVVEQVEKSFLK